MNTKSNHNVSDGNPVDELSCILSVPPAQSAFILAALAANGRIVLVDEANRDVRPFVSFLSRLTGRKAQCKYCSSRTSLEQADVSLPLVLERMEALSPDEQTRLAEKLLFDGSFSLLVGTVNSRTEAENLSEELRAAIGAVIDLAPISKTEIERLLKEGGDAESARAELSDCWKKICETCAKQSQEDLVKPVSVLADWIGRVETSAVLSRPPIDALRAQAKILACLKSLAETFAPSQLKDFGSMNDVHASLLAHRLFRIEAGGRTNVGIVHAALDEASKELELHSISKSSRAKEESLSEAWEVYSKIHEYLAKKVIGREDGEGGDGPDLGNDEKGLGTINLMLTALFSEGHILFEDFPGTGKSYMVEMLSDCISDDVIEVGINIAGYKRIQCVPDLMPSDITGYEALVGNRMVFRPGPVFAYFLLLDEINRTTPKVQAALLEAMGEKRVSVGNHRYNLGGIFFVLASQNPLDAVGTYPLPAAQLDRFLFKRRLEPVTQDAVNQIIQMDRVREDGPRIPVSRLRRAIRTVGDFIDPNWPDILPELQAIREVVQEREKVKELQAGSTPSPRSMQKLGRALQALAFVKGAKERDPSKTKVHKSLIREIALDYFGHRIFPSDALQGKWSEEGSSPVQEQKKYVLAIIDQARAEVQQRV